MAFRSRSARVSARALSRVWKTLVHRAAVAEADFGFGGVDVGVDGFGREVEEEDEGGDEGVVEDVAVGLFDGVEDDFVAHVAAVDEAVLLRAFAFGEGGFGNEAVKRHAAGLGGTGREAV